MKNIDTKYDDQKKYFYYMLLVLSRVGGFILVFFTLSVVFTSCEKGSEKDVEPIVIDTTEDSLVHPNPDDVADSNSMELENEYDIDKAEQKDKEAAEAHQKAKEEEMKSSQFREKSCETLLSEYEDLLRSQEDMENEKFNNEIKEFILDHIFLECEENEYFRLEKERLEEEYL